MISDTVKKFYQNVQQGDFVSHDGWRIIPDPLVEGGNNFLQIWRLIGPDGQEQAVSHSPFKIDFNRFEIEPVTFVRLKKAEQQKH